MAEDVKMRFAGDSADAERAIAQLERKFEGLENKIRQLHQASKKQTDDGTKGLGLMASGAASLASNLTGITGPLSAVVAGIQLAKTEFQDLLDRQEKAAKTQLTYAKVLEGLAVSLHGDASLTLPQAKQAIAKMTVETGVESRFLGQALDTGISAKGHLAASEVLPMIKAIALAVPQLQEQHAPMVATGLDVRKTDPTVTPEGFFGFMLAAKQQARITDIESFSQHGMPGIIGLTKLDGGKNWGENAAIYSALTSAAQDPSGRKSRTSSVALALQLREFLGDAPGLDTNLKRIEFMQQNPEARKAFLYGGEFQGKKGAGLQMTVTGPGGEQFQLGTDRASFERQMFPAIEGLLTGGTTDAKSLSAALQAIPGANTPAAVAGYQEFVKNIKNDPIIANADRELKLKALADAERIRQLESGQTAIVRTGLEDVQSAVGMNWLTRTTNWVDYQARTQLGGQSGSEAAQGILETYMGGYRKVDENHPMIEKLQAVVDTLKSIDHHVKPQPGLNGQKEGGANE